MTVKTSCRRRTDRYTLPVQSGAQISFGYPWPGGYRCSMRLRDVSSSGVSFVLGLEFPGLEVGQPIEQAAITVGDFTVIGDLVVMHLTPDAGAGSVCGALFLPDGDENVLALRDLLQTLALQASWDGAVLR